MVIAALVAFAILLIAWIFAPSGARRGASEVASPEVAEPIAA